MAFFTAIATAIGGIFTTVSTFIGGLGVIGSALFKIGLSIGLSLLSQALAGKPKKPGFSVQGKLQAGDDTPRSVILGLGATAGSLVYANTWGKTGDTPNAFLTYVIAVGDKPYQGIWAIWVNGSKCTVLWNEPDNDGKGFPVQEYRKGGRDYLWVNFYDGNQTAADPFMVSKFATDPDRPYEATRIGYGMPYMILHALVHDELWTGFPTYKFEFVGIPLYDVSKDTTAGGDGDHRWDDPDTWGGDGDFLPAVQIYNILRGMQHEGQWFYGLQGVTAARLPAANWIAAIEKCRLPIDGPDGSEPQYRAGGEIQVGAEIATALEALLTACNGRLTEVGGVYTLHVGSPGEASFSITDGDIISTAEQTFTPFFGLDDTINGVSAKYPSPGDGWSIKVAPPLYRSDLEVLDAGRRLMADVSFDLVPYPWQVQRLMLSSLEEARRFRRHTITLPPKLWALAVPNAFFEWNSYRNGYETKLFRIDGVVDRGNLDIVIDCTEVDPTDYDFDFDTDYVPPVVVPPIVVRPGPQVIVDWYAEGVLLEGASGSLRAGIRLVWDGDQADIDGVEWEVKLAGAADDDLVHNGSTSNYEIGQAIITQAIVQETDYEVRGRYVSYSGRPQDWSAWLAVTTPSAPAVSAPSDVLDGVLDRSKLSAVFRSALAEVSQSVMRVRDEINATIADLTAAQATENGSNYSSLSLVKVANANAFIAITNEETARITEDSAIYTSLNAVVATVEDPDTGLAAIGSIVDSQAILITNNASGISTLVTTTNAIDARLTTAEGTITTQATAISTQTVRVDQLNVAIGGTATAGSSTTITLQVGTSAPNNYFVGLPITLTGGTGAGQTSYITAYNGTTRVATVSGWSVAPASGTTYSIGNALGQVALSSMINSVSTTVAGHTSSISTLAASYSGLAAQYGILFDIDGATGGAIITGFTRLDNSVVYDAIFSVDTFTIANLQNLVRNWIFDANGATVNVASKYDIARWAVTANLANVDVVANSDNGSLLSTPYCLKLSLSSAFEIYTDEDPAQTNGAVKGFAVQNGQKFKLRFQAVSSSGTVNLMASLRIKNSAGTVSTADSTIVGVTSGAGNYYEVTFTANVSGRGYLRFSRSSTSGNVWLTEVELMRMNASLLIVDGSIIADFIAANAIETDKLVANSVTTLKINGQAVTAPIFDEIATGADDKTGTGLGASYANVHTHTETDIRIPNGETVTVFAMWTAVLEFTGAGGWDFRMDIAGDTDNARIYAPSGAAQQYFVTMTGTGEFTSSTDGDQTLGVAINWKGESTVKVRRRNVFVCFVKR